MEQLIAYFVYVISMCCSQYIYVMTFEIILMLDFEIYSDG